MCHTQHGFIHRERHHGHVADALTDRAAEMNAPAWVDLSIIVGNSPNRSSPFGLDMISITICAHSTIATVSVSNRHVNQILYNWTGKCECLRTRDASSRSGAKLFVCRLLTHPGRLGLFAFLQFAVILFR